MRIVAGRHRGRRLQAPPGKAVRPTSDRVREALFNILAHGHTTETEGPAYIGARIVDLFCGSAALGIEALSRGADHAVLIDNSPVALTTARRNLESLDEDGRATLLRADATRLPPASAPCRLALIDPPYGRGLAVAALAALVDGGWLDEGAVCAVELAAGEAFEPPTGFVTADDRRYGRTRLVILRWRPTPQDGG